MQRPQCLFACACVREIWHLLTDERSKQAIVVSEKFADGLVTQQELTAAWNAAWAASVARGAACTAANAAASDAATEVETVNAE